MKILSLNTWQEKGPWRERWEIAFKEIREFDADIIAFQEVFSEDWSWEIAKRAGYPSRVFGDPASGLLLVSKYPVKRSECLTMKTQSPTEEYRRYVLFAEFEVPASSYLSPLRRGQDKGRSIAFFNTHLSWRVAESEVRLKQVRELIAFAEKRAPGMTAFAAGDFNSSPETPEIREMLSAGWRDTFDDLSPGAGDLTWDNKNPYAAGASVFLPDRRIDYVFMKPGPAAIAPESCRVVLKQPNENGVYASDHYGVLLDLKGG